MHSFSDLLRQSLSPSQSSSEIMVGATHRSGSDVWLESYSEDDAGIAVSWTNTPFHAVSMTASQAKHVVKSLNRYAVDDEYSNYRIKVISY